MLQEMVLQILKRKLVHTEKIFFVFGPQSGKHRDEFLFADTLVERAEKKQERDAAIRFRRKWKNRLGPALKIGEHMRPDVLEIQNIGPDFFDLFLISLDPGQRV